MPKHEYYRLKQDTLYQLDNGEIVVIKAGETCGYYGHSDTYLFQARSNEIPSFARLVVESLPAWFEAVDEQPIPWQGEPAEPRTVSESDEYF